MRTRRMRTMRTRRGLGPRAPPAWAPQPCSPTRLSRSKPSAVTVQVWYHAGTNAAIRACVYTPAHPHNTSLCLTALTHSERYRQKRLITSQTREGRKELSW